MTKSRLLSLYNQEKLKECEEEAMVFIMDRKRKEQYNGQISDMCRQRLLGYAETFKELSKSFNGEFTCRRQTECAECKKVLGKQAGDL